MRLAIKLLLFGSFLGYYATLVYSEYYQPRNFGIDWQQKEDRMAARKVLEKHPAGRAGLKVGDALVKIDANRIATYRDWIRFQAERELGRTYLFVVARGGLETNLPVTLRQLPGTAVGWFETKRGVQAFLLLAAAILAFGTKPTAVSRVGALVLAGIGTAPAFPESEMTAIWRNLPAGLGIVLWIPQITHLFVLPLLFSFLALIPRPLFKSRTEWIVLFLPAMLLAAWCLPRIYHHIYYPPTLTDLPKWFHAATAVTILFYGVGGIVALWMNYARVSDDANRRRALIFALGTTVGFLPLTLFLAAIFGGNVAQSEWVLFFVSDGFRRLTLSVFILFPIAILYMALRGGLLGREIAENPLPRSKKRAV